MAANLWKTTHSKEVQRRAEQNQLAKTALFHTLFPDEQERPGAAFKLVQSMRSRAMRDVSGNSGDSAASPDLFKDKRVIESAMVWMEANKHAYRAGLESREMRTGLQFLHLYGSSIPHHTKPAYVQSSCVSEWDMKMSNCNLTYTNDNSTVERVGSTSCYPAAFSKLVSERSALVVMVEAAPLSSNWLTFGVAKMGAVATSSSDGIGRTNRSWGICDDRNNSSSRASVFASGIEEVSFRKLREGDMLKAVVDTLEGWVQVSVNEDELVHRFRIDPGSTDEYVFAMTFANNHRVTIISDSVERLEKMEEKTDIRVNVTPEEAAKANEVFPSPPFTPLIPTEGVSDAKPAPPADEKDTEVDSSRTLSVEHTLIFASFKKHLRLILTGKLSSNPRSIIDPTQSLSSKLAVDPSVWLSMCADDDDYAQARYDQLARPALSSVLHLEPSSKWPKQCDSDGEAPLTWTELVAAASWYKYTSEKEAVGKQEEAGAAFGCMHGEDAPFIAAITLADYYNSATATGKGKKSSGDRDRDSSSNTSLEDETIGAALAYMLVFPEDQQLWYDYNRGMEEPLIPTLDCNCRCLPRHQRNQCRSC